jgi:branched-chain amino acid transport system permease protein
MRSPVLFALCVPLLGIYPVFMMKLLCFAMFACAYNLLLGFSGMLSFGHAAFFGSSAYATAWLATAQGWGRRRRYWPASQCRRWSA